MRSNSFQGGESPGGAAHDAADIPAPAYVTELFNDLHDAPAELNALDPSKADRNTKIRDLALAVSGAMDLFEHHLARTPILTSVNSYIQFLGQLKSYVEEAPHAIVDMDPQAAILFNAVSAQIDRVANSRARLNPTAVDDDANPLESCCKTMRSAARRCLGRAIDSDVEMADDASIHSSPSPQTESSPAPDAQDPPAYVKSLFQSLGHLQVNSTSSAKGEVGSGRLNTFGWAAHSLMTALESDMEEIEVLPCEWPLQLLEKLKTTFAGLSEIDGIDTETEMLFTAASNSIKHLEARLSDDIVSEGAIGHELNTLMDALCWNVQTAVATYLSASDDLDVEMANASPESIDAGDALEREAQDREPTWGGIARNPRRRPIAGEESDEDSPPRKKQKLGDKDKGKSLAARDDEIGDSATPQEGIILKQEILDLYEHGDQSLRVGALKSVQDIVLFLGNKQFLDKGKSEYWATKGTKKYLSKWLNDYVDAYLSNNNLTIQEAFKTFDSFIKHRDAMMNVAETEGYIPVPTRDGERSKMINVRSAWNTVAEAFFEIPLIEYVKKHFPESLSQHLYAICDFAIHLQEEKVNFETMTPQSFSSEVLAMLSQSKYKKFTKHVNALHSLRDALFPYGLRDQVVTMDPNMSTSNKTGALQLETYLLSQDINYTDYQPSPSRYRDRIEKWWNKPKNAGIGRALTLSATMPEKKPALNTPPPVSDWRRSNEDRHAKTKQHSEIVNDPDISETEPLDAKAEAYKTSDSAIPLKDSARERVEGAGRTKKSMTVLLTGGAYGGANHKLINAAIEPGKTLLDHMKTLADFANFERRVWAQPHVASTSVNTKHNLSALLDQLCDAAFDVPIMMYTLERVGRGDKGRTLNAARRLGKALAEKGAHFTDRKALLQAMLKIAESLKAEKTEILSDFMNIRRKLFKHPVDEIFLEELKVRKTTDNELTTSRIAAAGGIALALEVMKPPISWAEFIKKPLDHLDKISSVLKKVMTQKRLTDAIKILDDWSKGSVYHPSVSKPRLWYTPTIASFRRRLGGNMRALYKRRGIDAHEAAKAPVAELEKKSVQEERRLPRTQAARMDRDGGESETESNASSIEIPTRHRSARPTRFQGPFYQDADSEMSDTEPSRPVPAPENEESHSQDARLADAPSLPPSAVPRQPGLFHYRGPDETNPYKQIHLLMQRHADGTESVVGPAEPAKLLPDQGQDRLLPWACPHNSSHVEERYRLSDKPGEQHLVHPDVEILSAHIEGDDLALLQDYYAHQRFNVSYDEGYAALKPKQKTEVAKWIKALEANALAHVNAMRQGKPLYEKTLEVAPVTEADAAHHEIHVMTEEKMDGVRVKASLAGKEPTLLRKQFLGPFGGPVYKQSELDQKKGLHQRDATYLLDVGESEAAAGETPEPLLMDGQNKMASINTAVRFNPKTGALEYDGDRLNAFLIGVNFTIKDKFDGPPHKRRLAFVAGEDGGLKAGQSVLVGYGDHYSQYLNRHYLDKYTARYKDRVGEWMRTFRDELKRLRDAGEPPAEQRYGTFIPWMVAAENRRKPGLNAEMFDSIDALQRRLAASAGETTLRGLLNVGKDDTHRVAFNLHRDANGAVHLQVLEPAVRADYLPEIEAKLCPDAADRITHF
ncbi:MAG TPA: YopJ family acetyltransferase, partial [Burkholderiales bacterium]|nr:YopJ family acetyltransferase [Burkholderiales bacterium]